MSIIRLKSLTADRLVRLGSFATVEAASAAYIAAKRELHKDGCTL